MDKIKNVIIINDFDYINGGASKVALSTAEILDKQGKNVYFFSAIHKEKNDKSNIKYITTNQKEPLKDSNKLRGIINGIYNFKAKRKLKKLLKNLKKENTIIHIHSWIKALSSSIFDVISKEKFRCIVTFHDYFFMCPNGGFFNYKNNKICEIKPLSLQCIKCNCDSRSYFFKIYRIIRHFVQKNIVKINSKIKYVVCISDYSYNILKKGIKEKAIVKRINNPIDVRKEQIVNIENNNYYIYVGRVAKEKGVKLFCNAIKELGYKGIVVGDGEELEELQKEFIDIDFVGWKNSKDVFEYMKKARALIFPSLCNEGAPLTILEALSIGLPCIVTDKCASSEFIENSVNGLIFKRNNIESLKENIKILNNNEILKEISQNSYKKYWNSPFDIDKYKEEINSFYEEVLNLENEII